ncbi:MAG: nucleotidyltransferase family protein [Parvibaculaceae bacterium]
MTHIGRRAMIMAAGLGQRMRPLTNGTPKPLVEVAGVPLIEYGLGRLDQAGCDLAVVNVHYLPEQIEAWARRKASPRIVISDERRELLDTGGGIVKALPLLGNEPFFVVNSDSIWIDSGRPALARLIARWDDARMDCLLLLCHPRRTIGYDGHGDFLTDAGGRIIGRPGRDETGLAYIGAYLVHPRLFANVRLSKFSMNLLWDRAVAEKRLYGIEHEGRWLHVGTPEAIPLAERALGG